jgi:hypothetical protein
MKERSVPFPPHHHAKMMMIYLAKMLPCTKFENAKIMCFMRLPIAIINPKIKKISIFSIHGSSR